MNDYQTGEWLRLETEDENAMTTTTMTSLPVKASSELESTSSPAIAIHISILSLLMLLTLLGNVIVIITITSCAELRKKRVNGFIVSLAVGDLIVCFVGMPTYILTGANSGQWKLGAIACTLSAYVLMVLVAFTTFLLTALSIDRYQVRRHLLPSNSVIIVISTTHTNSNNVNLLQMCYVVCP